VTTRLTVAAVATEATRGTATTVTLTSLPRSGRLSHRPSAAAASSRVAADPVVGFVDRVDMVAAAVGWASLVAATRGLVRVDGVRAPAGLRRRARVVTMSAAALRAAVPARLLGLRAGGSAAATAGRVRGFGFVAVGLDRAGLAAGFRLAGAFGAGRAAAATFGAGVAAGRVRRRRGAGRVDRVPVLVPPAAGRRTAFVAFAMLSVPAPPPTSCLRRGGPGP